jgi:radical SAM family uncharacterized protein
MKWERPFELENELWPLLATVKHPSRYIGQEWGAVDIREGRGKPAVRICLAFPDVYEVGMSFLGFQILYALANSIEGVLAERAYCPWIDMEKNLRAKSMNLASLESGTALKDFDAVGFTLQYELTATNILTMLDLGGIPLRSEDRGEEAPIIMGGGPGALSPEPLVPFFDIFCLGDGEELLPSVLKVIEGTRGLKRAERLACLAKVAGVYVPGMSTLEFSSNGGSIRSEQPLPLKRQFIDDMDTAFVPQSLVVPNSGIIHDRVPVEVFRGCTRGCRFCQAGMIYRPVRERSPERVAEIACDLLGKTGWEEVGLVSLSSCDYSGLVPVLESLSGPLRSRGIKLSLPSLRMDAFSVDLAARLETVKRGGLTFAPEAGSQRLRDVINKGITEEDIRLTLESLSEHGWDRVKLYFMVGLPTEEEEDLEGILEISKMAFGIIRKRHRRAEVSVSVNGFIPKPHTPFQWEGQLPFEEMENRCRWLKRQVGNPRIALNYHDPKQGFIEAVFARGDRRLANVIETAWRNGCRFDGWTETFKFDSWMQAFESEGVDPGFYANRQRSKDEVFPWDHIDTGVAREFLWREREKAFSGLKTPDCRNGNCNGCGFKGSECPGLLREDHR